MSYRDKKDGIFFSGAVFDEEIGFERSCGFPCHEHGKPLRDFGVFNWMRWTDDDFFPWLRHPEFNLEHSAGVELVWWLVDFFATDTSQ